MSHLSEELLNSNQPFVLWERELEGFREYKLVTYEGDQLPKGHTTSAALLVRTRDNKLSVELHSHRFSFCLSSSAHPESYVLMAPDFLSNELKAVAQINELAENETVLRRQVLSSWLVSQRLPQWFVEQALQLMLKS